MTKEKIFITSKTQQAFQQFLSSQALAVIWAFPLNKEIQKLSRGDETRELSTILKNLVDSEESKPLFLSSPTGSGSVELLMSSLSKAWELGVNSPHIFFIKAENAHNILTFITELTAYLMWRDSTPTFR